MKKSAVIIPLVVTALFIGFLMGFAVARNHRPEPIITSTFPVDGPSLSQMGPNGRQNDASLVNINTADLRTLVALPGLDLILSQRIIDYRRANGPFKHKEDLLMIERLGPYTLELLYDLITIGG